MVKAVFFDMGGVIVSLDIDACILKFKRDAGFTDIDKYLHPSHQQGFIGRLEAGDITEDEFIQEALKHCRPGATRQTVVDCFKPFLAATNPDTINFIRELRDKGYTLFILSNNNPICSRICEDLIAESGLPPREVFSKFFYSYDMKLMKPGAEIYEKAIAESGFSKDEIVFIDDSAKNVAGAQAVGLKTITFTEGMDIREEFKKYESI